MTTIHRQAKRRRRRARQRSLAGSAPTTSPPGPALRLRPHAQRPRRSRRSPKLPVRPAALPYVLPAVAGAVVASTWFAGGKLVAGGDIGLFVFSGNMPEFSWAWNHSLSGAGSPSFRISVAPAILLHRAVRSLGGSDSLAQALWYSSLLAGVGLGASYFAGAFTRRRAVISAAGLIAVVNPVILTDSVNSMTLLSLGLMGLLGGVVLRAAGGTGPRPVLFGLASVGAAYLANNPPSLAVLVAWIIATAVAAGALIGHGSTSNAFRYLLRASPWVALLNAWWIVPVVLTLGVPGSDLRLAAETEVRSWSWSHRRASIGNVLTLNAKWAWGDDRYFPVASAVDRPGWALLRWVLPVAAVLAPVAARGRRRMVAALLATAVLVLAFLAKGVHPPFEDLNLWLYDHVPGFWLLRSPASKLSPAILLLYAALFAVLITSLHERFSRRRPILRTLPAIAGTLVVAATFAYSYPLWNGSHFRTDADVFTARHVEVPESWSAVAGHLNGSRTRGKVLQLPLLDYYQVGTTWGYYGIDSIATALIERPVLQRVPGTYFSPSSEFDDLLGAAETAVSAADARAVPGLLQALGVSHVLVRHDLDPGEVAGRNLVPPHLATTNLDRVPGLKRSFANEVADVFEVASDAETRLQSYAGPVRVEGEETFSTAGVASAAGVGAVSTSGPGVAIVELSESERSLEVDVPGRYRLTETLTSPRTYIAEMLDQGAGPVVEFRPLTDVTIGDLGEQRAGTVRVAARLDSAGVMVGDHFHRFQGGRALVPVDTLGPVAIMGPDRTTPALGPLSGLGDCLAIGDDDGLDLGLGTADLAMEPPPAFMLTALRHRACRAAEVRWHRGRPVQIAFEHRGRGPRPPEVCLWEAGPDRCAPMPPLQPSGDWARFEFVHLPTPETTGLSLFFYASGMGTGEATTTEYRAVQAWNVTESATTTLQPVAPARLIDVPPGEHRAEFRVLGKEVPALGPFGDVGDCLRRPPGARDDVAVSARALSGAGVELRARSASACVAAPVQRFVSRAAYRLRFDYRQIAGGRPRVCVYQSPARGCVALPALLDGDGWRSYEATFTPSRRAEALTLFLYADGADGRETVTQYRRMSVELAAQSVVVATPVPASGSGGPEISWRQRNPARFEASVTGAAKPFLLVLTESFSRQWTLRGLPPGATARHLRAHGYANGWLISGARGDLELTAEYTPAALGRASIGVSSAAAIVALALLGPARMIRRRVRSVAAGKPS